MAPAVGDIVAVGKGEERAPAGGTPSAAPSEVQEDEPTHDELCFLAAVYDRRNGNLAQLAEICQVTKSLMDKKPPTDGMDFGRKLFNGTYTTDRDGVASAALRKQLRVQIQVKTAELKRSKTEELIGEASQEDLDAFAAIYRQYRGNLDVLSAKSGADFALMRRHAPMDARDWAKKLLSGWYTGEVGPEQKKAMQDRLRRNLKTRRQVPLQLHARMEAGSLTATCTNLSGEELRQFVGLDPMQTGQVLATRVHEEIPAPPKAEWSMILPSGDVLDSARLLAPMRELFEVDQVEEFVNGGGKAVAADAVQAEGRATSDYRDGCPHR